jgi:ABC-type multidrug transport system permease subunit
MNRVLTLAAFNIRVLLSERTWFFLAWALFGLQLVIYGSMMSRLVGTHLPDYYYFYGVGLMIIIVFDSAADVGRHFVEHAHEGELPYFLALPVSRKGFLTAQAIYGVVNTLLKVAPPLLVVLYFWGQLTPVTALFAIGALFILGLGISGFMISMSFIAFKSVDIYSAVIAGLSALLVRFSTVFYPLAYMPSYYSPVAVFSPLTWGADLTRWLIGFGPQYVDLNPALAIAVVMAVAVGTLWLSTRIVDNIIEGVKAA